MIKIATIVIAIIFALTQPSAAKLCNPYIKINNVSYGTSGSISESIGHADSLWVYLEVSPYNCFTCSLATSLVIINIPPGFTYNAVHYCGFIADTGSYELKLGAVNCDMDTERVDFSINVRYAVNRIQSIEKETAFEIVPTLSSGIFQIKASDNILIKYIRITDEAGNIVLTADRPLPEINLTDRAPGFYFYAATDDKQRIYKGRIVKLNP